MWWLYNGLYGGAIKRLVIIAAPSGAGKSTFLDNSTTMLSGKLPAELHDLHELATEHHTIRDLRRVRQRSFENLCMHVDLSRPVRKLKRRAGNRDDLLASLTPRLYENWKELNVYMQRATEVHIATMFVRREEHYRRLLERYQRKGSTRKWNAAVELVSRDAANNSELHRKAYDAWRRFLTDVDTCSNHIIDANTNRYFFTSKSEFDKEIDFGYQGGESIPGAHGSDTAHKSSSAA